MVTTVFLVRHGRTVGAEERRYKGTLDVPLNEVGMKQIEATGRAMGRYLKDPGLKLKAVYCSDLSRARDSAGIIASPLGITPVVDKRLRERHFGRWEGMSFDEIKEQEPEAFNDWAANPLTHSPPGGGESTLEVRERTLPAFHEITGRHQGDTVCIVSHGGVLRVILCELMGVPLQNIFQIEQDFAALNIIELHGDYPIIKGMNITG